MKIFISHSMIDYSLLQHVEGVLKPSGLTLLRAEHQIDTQATITDKIRNMIGSCDMGLVLLTENGFNSGFVREEIGQLYAKEKPIILFIEQGFEKQYTGFRFGHDLFYLTQ